MKHVERNPVAKRRIRSLITGDATMRVVTWTLSEIT